MKGAAIVLLLTFITLCATMPVILDIFTLAIRFIAPSFGKQQWSDINLQLKSALTPIHFGLRHNFLNVQEAATQFSSTLVEFLKSKPEFISEVTKESEGHIKQNPKTLSQSRSFKNELRKKLENSANPDPNDRKLFGQSVRYHNYLLKEQRKKDKENARKHQEKMFGKNFWEFSRKVCQGKINEAPKKPTFTKECADNFYPSTYSVAPEYDRTKLNWFPFLAVPEQPKEFNMSAIKPGDIKKILSAKKSTAAPGPDAFTYGVLKHLPSTHHLLATIYSKILLDSPSPPSLWQQSKVTLIYKRNETSVPKNFRMIALTSVAGKIFHQIISDRMLDYLISNGYIDSSLQKAFIKNINGTIEHNQVLQQVISHARRNKRTVHITFFDLKDAFGSISHSLIDDTLKRYRIPENVQRYIHNLYSGLSGTVMGPGWESEPFIFKRGVFQGDPLSPTIFITVFNPLLEYLKSESKHGYKIDNTSVITTPFADDFNVITCHAKAHQRIIRNIESFAGTMNLILEPNKCRSLSISGGSSKNISFKLKDMSIESLESTPEKFLGSCITFKGKQSEIYDFIHDGLKECLENISNCLVSDSHKLEIYTKYLLPAIRFRLTVHEITATNLKTLDRMCDQYLKQWLHIPQSGTPAMLHAKSAMNIKTLEHIYKECHAIAHTTSRLKADSTVNAALSSKLAYE